MKITDEKICYKNLGDIYRTTYEAGQIVSIGLDDNKDFYKLTDTATVNVKNKDYSIPFYYRCRKGYYNNEVGLMKSLPDGKVTFSGASRAFRIGDPVVVLCKNDNPVYIIGHHNKPIKPSMCVDMFMLGTTQFPRDNHYVPGTPINIYIQASKQSFYAAVPEPDNSLKCDFSSEVVWWSKKFIWGSAGCLLYLTDVEDWTIWLVHMGAIAITIEVRHVWSVDYGYTRVLQIWSDMALWSKKTIDLLFQLQAVPQHLFTLQPALTQTLIQLTALYGLFWNNIDMKIKSQDRSLWQ